MNCNIYNNCGGDFGDLESHIQDMYGFFANKYNFDKHPDIHLDSDEQNKAEILGKTAYYDPQSYEVHIYTDNRHPKDMLRSIAHELIHHKQNLENRLQVGGYNGPGYYLKNDKLKEVEHEAMLEGNACMREWEDTKKYKNLKESKNMSLNEWKNNELNKLLLKKFGILKEAAKPDFIDIDGDGDKEEDMKKAAADKKKSGGEKKKSSKPKKGEVPDQLKPHVKSKKEDKDMDESHCMEEGHCKDKLEEEELDEGRNNPRTTNADKFAGHEDRYHTDRIHEEEKPKTAAQKASADKKISDPPKTLTKKMTKDGRTKFVPVKEDEDAKDKDSKNKKYNFNKKNDDKKEKENTLQEAVRRIAKARKVFLNGKRIK